MTHPETILQENHHNHYDEVYNKTVFGFWIYLLTDFVLFGVLFAAYSVLRNNSFGGPSGHQLFDIEYTLIQTFILLAASFFVGLAGAAAHRKIKGGTIILFLITFLLGIAFMAMEFHEFSRFVTSGNSWTRSAFLSAYFTLVGTHGVHVLFGLLWIIVLIIPVCIRGLTSVSIQRLTCLRMFWQFLNIIWVFIFTFVYLMGVLKYD